MRIRVAALLLPIVLIGAGFAATFFFAQSEYRALRHSYGGVWTRGDPLYVPDPEIGFGPYRGGVTQFHVRGTDRFVEVSTNPQGLRVPPGRRQTSVTSADVVTVGCSFTFGHGVDAAEAYPAVAAEVSGLTVANAAFSAYGTTGALLALERLSALRPKVVVYGFLDAHMKRNVSPCAPGPFAMCRSQAYVAITARGPEIRPPSGGDWGGRLGRRLLAELDRPEGLADGWRGLALLAGNAVARLTTPHWTDSPENQEAALSFLLHRMKGAAAAMGARLVVVRIPSELTGADAPRGFSPVPAALTRSLPPGVELIDETSTVAALPPHQSLRLSSPDGHPAPLVHRAIGEDLGQRLREHFSH